MFAFLCWILMKMPLKFGTIFTACLFTGVIVFINSPYTLHIWYPKADIMIHLADAGLCRLNAAGARENSGILNFARDILVY